MFQTVPAVQVVCFTVHLSMSYVFCIRSGFTTVDITSIFPDRRFSFKCLPGRGCVHGLLLTMRDVMQVTCYKAFRGEFGVFTIFSVENFAAGHTTEIKATYK